MPWAKRQGIPPLPVVWLGHGGEDYLPSESQTFPVSGEVNTACPNTTHLEDAMRLYEKICVEVL